MKQSFIVLCAVLSALLAGFFVGRSTENRYSFLSTKNGGFVVADHNTGKYYLPYSYKTPKTGQRWVTYWVDPVKGKSGQITLQYESNSKVEFLPDNANPADYTPTYFPGDVLEMIK